MIDVKVYNREGKELESLQVDETVFGGEVRHPLLKQAIVMYHANKRVGTAATKSRGMVDGSTRKLYRQKGTGRARHGSNRSPLWAGGGTTFGPKPRSYSFRPPAKVREAALKSALSLYCKENKILILSDFDIHNGKTKEVDEVMQRYKIDSALIIDEKGNEKLRRGVRNLEEFLYLPPEGLNTFDILNYNNLILTLKGLKGIIKRFDLD